MLVEKVYCHHTQLRRNHSNSRTWFVQNVVLCSLGHPKGFLRNERLFSARRDLAAGEPGCAQRHAYLRL